MRKVSVLIADDHVVVRQGLRALLESDPMIEVTAEADNGAQAVKLARELRPEVVVMDIAMPQVNGCDATRQILKHCPSTKIVALSSYREEECLEAMAKAGAVAFLSKQMASGDLLAAIHEARNSGFLLPKGNQPWRRLQSATFDYHKDKLTHRELQVLGLIAAGHRNMDIAGALGISIKTVEKHRQSVMNKLKIHETAGLTRYALSQGLLPAVRTEAQA